jgi:phosphoribosylformylglycinamidine synthase
MLARIYVTLKRGVLDPQGKAVARSLSTMGFEEVQDVRLGKYVEVELEEKDAARAKERLTEMCERLLANTVIEDFRIEIVGS